MFVRPHYINPLKTYCDVLPVKILAGMRHCGKSTVSEMLEGDLIKNGVRPDHMISMCYSSEYFDDGMGYSICACAAGTPVYTVPNSLIDQRLNGTLTYKY